MKNMIKGILFVSCLVLVACGSASDTENNTANNQQSNNNGKSDDAKGVELPLGSDCDIDSKCQDGYCAPKADDFCDGVCRAFTATGESCADPREQCDGRIDQCDMGVFEAVCKTKKLKGETCLFGQCDANTAYCKTEGTMEEGVCADLIAVDEPCPARFGCQEGLYCDALAAAPTCKVQAKLGQACDSDALFSCVGFLECDETSSLCVERAAFTCN